MFPSRSATLTEPIRSNSAPLPIPWILCTHPKGSIYFYNRNLRVVTDEDIRQPEVYESIMHQCSFYPISELAEGMEVLLHNTNIDAHVGFNLAVNHELCLASFELRDIYKLDSDMRLLNRHRRRYWDYIRRHPAHVRPPKLALHDVVEALTWYYTDNLISGAESIVPFSKIECEDLLQILKNTTIYSDENSVSRTVFLAWILREVTSFRDAESYGQHTVKQLQALQSSRAKAPSASSALNERQPFAQTAIRWIINILFFTIPWTYLAHVKSSSEYRGRLSTVQQNWEAYIERLVREYSDFLLISTVLLSATVSFLSVSDLDSVSKAVTIVSAFASLGSIIVGTFSIWRHQTNTHRTAAFSYMHNAQHSPLGFEGHAMLLSLAPVLLVWAIVSFSAAILAYALQHFDNNNLAGIENAPAWIILAVFLLILAFVSMGLYTFSIIWKWQPPTSSFVRLFNGWRTRGSKESKTAGS